MDTRQEIVKAILAEMRATLENRDGLPQAYVNSRVVNLSTLIAAQTYAPILPDELRFIP